MKSMKPKRNANSKAVFEGYRFDDMPVNWSGLEVELAVGLCLESPAAVLEGFLLAVLLGGLLPLDGVGVDLTL
jgi:hypothetical protein